MSKGGVVGQQWRAVGWQRKGQVNKHSMTPLCTTANAHCVVCRRLDIGHWSQVPNNYDSGTQSQTWVYNEQELLFIFANVSTSSSPSTFFTSYVLWFCLRLSPLSLSLLLSPAISNSWLIITKRP
ncbi:unnamed protein product [Prunus armeniaca]|uniref:Uncharacterized protein n=1 Tax=Prunus armeniaca TaxID=36596 RepID=A0A6J5U2A5_PRUAR|nr:unnamed protein product [Prunus armeniaca]CAB4300712.1 unnamed protein product [Prunus armeniaca]